MKHFYNIYSPFFLFLCILCLLPRLSRAQEKASLKAITPGDYSKWYQLYNGPGPSRNGNWIGYKLYNEETDTLIIQQIHGSKKYKFPRAGRTEFLGDSIAAFLKDSSSLLFLNSGLRESFTPGTEFKMSHNGLNILIFHKPSGRLQVKSLLNKELLLFEGINAYYYNGVLESICMISTGNGTGKTNLIILEKGIRKKNISIPENREVLELNWHPDGGFIAFTLGSDTLLHDSSDAGLVGYYDLRNEKIRYLNPSEKAGFPRGNVLVSHWDYPLALSPDGNQVFFPHMPKRTVTVKENPEIWKWDDPYIRKRAMGWSDFFPKISMWNTIQDDYLEITDQHFPKAYYGLVKDYALVYNPAQYRSYNEALNDTSDIFLMDLLNGERKLMIGRHPDNPGSLIVSPSGRYVLYLAGNHWWCYDTQKDILSDLTKKIKSVSGARWENEDSVLPPEGWDMDERAVYMYDPFDMWKIAIDNTPSERITSGREKGMRFRLITSLRDYNSTNTIKGAFLNDSLLFFEISRGDSMGYAYRHAGGTITFLFFKECFTQWPEISNDGTVIAFQCENFNVPPCLLAYPLNGDSLLSIFQSNPHYRYYEWPDRKKITYVNKTGKKLIGFLYYPTGYKKDFAYPMVVHVYEKQSKYRNHYVTPSLYTNTGYNPINLASDGYFVFLPDIDYEIGNPGFSASDCIISGTKAALENAPIDPARIGLMGQSFGGYETLFTITQTDLFATAIAGAGIADYTSDYLTMEGDKIRFYQYEKNQLRMGKSLFEDYKGYLENSPIYHALNVHIPLLLYTGGKDYHVNFQQSIAFYLAMKRLRKPNTMIIYPEEDHAFFDLGNMKDLTIKTHQWFAHYLKGGVKMDWMP